MVDNTCNNCKNLNNDDNISKSIGNIRDLSEIDLRRLIEYLKVSHPFVLKEAMKAMYIGPLSKDHSGSGLGTMTGTTTTVSANRIPVMHVTEITENETTTTLSSMMQDPVPPVVVSPKTNAATESINETDGDKSVLQSFSSFMSSEKSLKSDGRAAPLMDYDHTIDDEVQPFDHKTNQGSSIIEACDIQVEQNATKEYLKVYDTARSIEGTRNKEMIHLNEIKCYENDETTKKKRNEEIITNNDLNQEGKNKECEEEANEKNNESEGVVTDLYEAGIGNSGQTEIATEGTVSTSTEGRTQNSAISSAPKQTSPTSTNSTAGCYLVYDSSSNGRLMLYYSKIAVPNAVGFWAPSTKHKIQEFKFKRNMGRSELIGNCAAGVTGRKNYYSGWCQFIRAAKALQGSVTVFPRMGNEGLDVDIYVYFKPPFEPDGQQTVQIQENTLFQLSCISAVTCLPKLSTLFDEYAKLELNHWMTFSSKVGASTSFADPDPSIDAAFMAHLIKGKNYEPTKYDTAALKSATKYDASLLKPTRSKAESPPLWDSGVEDFNDSSSSSSIESDTDKFEVTTKPPVPVDKKSKAYPPTIPASFMDDCEFQRPTPEEVSISKAHTGCYLVYNLDGAKLMVHYSKVPVPNALGFWQPSNKYKIQGFKFKQNHGRNDLQTNCASGVTGRKNYYSGICQFIRMAKNLDGTVYLYNKNDKPGLDVDVYVYYDDLMKEELKKPQTFKVEHETAFYTGGIQAVTCLPKHAEFYEDNMTIDLNHWMTKASAVGAASRFAVV